MEKRKRKAYTEVSGEVEYSVERIVAKRIRKGKVEYELKWEGYSSSENTWERIENLVNCEKLVLEFENTHKTTQNQKLFPLGNAKKKVRRNTVPVGFDYGHEVEEILGAHKDGDELMLYVSWKGVEECSFIPASAANEKIPLMVIAFYESRIRWEL